MIMGLSTSVFFALLVRLLLLSNSICVCNAKRRVNEVDVEAYREKVKRMFYHAYDGYLKYAYPYDELKPLTCQGHDTWGSYSLTLIDAMDTLAVMGNYSEFRRIANIVIDKGENAFDMDINVSVFETNIRIVGGLISAHLMMKRAGMELEEAWPCSGPLLRMADSIARKLLPAFDTPTGMPYGTVNLRNGVPKGETAITCTAGVGTFMIEFGTLSRLTGDPIFEKTAVRAIRSLWKFRSPLGLLGNHIDVKTGKWTALDAGIGGGVDSYFEYLVKGSILFNLPELVHLFREYEVSIKNYLKKDDWYMWAQMTKGSITMPMFTSLDAFWPSIQMMLGDIDAAMKTLFNFQMVWRQFGFTPEYYNIPKAEAHKGREGYPLRPELIESIMYLYRATKDPALLEMGVDIVESIERQAKTSCGYATVKDVRDHRLEDRMESFFLSETAKYLYLLFDTENFIHNNGSHGQVINTPSGSCVIEAGGYVFNTEAHPIDLAAVHCCSAKKLEEDKILEDFHSNLDLLSLLNLVDEDDDFGMKDWSNRKKKKSKSNSKLRQENENDVRGGVNEVVVEDNDDAGNDDDGHEDKEEEDNESNQYSESNANDNVKNDVIKEETYLEIELPSGPSKSTGEQKLDLETPPTAQPPGMEEDTPILFVESLDLEDERVSEMDIAEKVKQYFKGTKFEEISERFSEKLVGSKNRVGSEEKVDVQDKSENEGNVEKSESEGNIEKSENEGNIEKSENEGNIEKSESEGNIEKSENEGNIEKSESEGNEVSTDKEKNLADDEEIDKEILIEFLSELKGVLTALETGSDQVAPVVLEQQSNAKKSSQSADSETTGGGESTDESLSKEDIKSGINHRQTESADFNSTLEKLRSHLELQIQQEEEKNSQKQESPSSVSEKISSLESKRENILSLTKKLINVFAGLSRGKLDVLQSKEEEEETSKIENDSPSLSNLYASLGKQALNYFDDPSSMHCPAQPFHSRLSVYGEFFVDE